MTDKSNIVEQARLDILAKLTDKKGTDLTQEEIKTILETYFTSESIPTELSDLTHNLISKDGGYTIKLSEVLNGVAIGTGGGDENPTGPNGKPLINQTTIAEITKTKIVGEDKFGNQVVIPTDFKLAQGENGSGDSVKDGIVIEDSEGNQYVWIPVSNINHDGSNKIKVNSATEEGVEITLGRYTFDTSSPGNPPMTDGTYQYASSYEVPVILGQTPTSNVTVKYFEELTIYRISNELGDKTGTNTTARGVLENGTYNGIKGFIESVRDNKGYYLARFEASYRTNGKAGSIASTSSDETLALTSMPSSRTQGDLYNFVKQGQAATACYDLYTSVNSDLVNSYAWDTAIVYIQSMGNTNYANKNRESNTTLKNTGKTGDQVCKIFDLASNGIELTTESSNSTEYYSGKWWAEVCVERGGYFSGDDGCAGKRFKYRASTKDRSVTFRSILYF